MNKKLLLLIPLLTLLLSFSFTSAQVLEKSAAEISPNLTAAPQHPNSTEAIWDVLFDYNLQQASGGSLGKAGICYIPTIDRIWVSYWSTSVSNYILEFNKQGVLVDSFLITGVIGVRAFTFDGTFVYAGLNTTTIQKINPVTRTNVGTITAPQTVRYLTYDPTANSGAGGLWLGNFSTNLQLISLTGTVLQTVPYAQLGNTSIYGAAFDNYSPGGPFLWLWGQGSGAGYPQIISQLNVATGLPTGIQHDALTDVGVGNTDAIAGGLDCSKDLVPGKIALLGVLQGVPDRLFAYEIGITDAGVLAPFNLTSPTAGAVIESFPNSATPVTITWDTSRAGASYKWIFGSPTVPPRSLTIPASTNQLTFTLGELDNILAGLGLQPGQQLVGQWDVWAFRGNVPDNDSLKATNGPRALTLKRGVPQLVPFNLANPANNSTITTSVFNNNPVVINWNRSGEGVTYRWKFGTGIAKSQGVMLNLPSNGGGFDTNLTIINSALDLTLAGLGVQPGGSIVGQWTVYAYSGNDSLKAVETFNLTLTRQAKGDVLVAYDSSSTNARISRDSVLSYLNLRNITFDLFNKGTNTSTNSMTFRGYQRIIWLGEGTNIMSLIQKDSLKAYLNNPTESKSKLIIFGEDVGYSLGRSASTYYDLDFVNNYLGFNFVLDRPPSGAAQRLKWIHYVPEFYDSTIGSWPDVLTVFDPINGHHLIQFTDGTYNATGKVAPMNNVVVFGHDIESLRRAFDSPVGPTHHRFLDYAIMYVDNDGIIPVELLSFNASISGNLITLNWVTATEMNNRGFEVQRKINDGSFETIAFIEGKGTTMEQQNYIFTDKASVAGNYSYRLKQVDFDGSFEITDAVEVDFTAPVDFSLNQNYPNPFNPTTIINFGLAVDANVSIKIYNTLGQEVTTLLNGEMKAGLHDVEFNASSFSSGVYFYQIEAQGVNGTNFSSVKKMMLMK